jgi:acetyltransferase
MVRLHDAYEIILGSSVDPQFGPVLLFGAGGQLVEIFKDRALGLPPLNATLARRMMEQTKIHQALAGVRGRKPVDLPALEELLVRFSRLVIEHPRIREIDINPLLVGPDQIIALDARVVLFPADVSDSNLPRPAIRPYPNQYIWPWPMRDGSAVIVRPIRPEDEPALRRFHETLSQRSVELRYFHLMKLSRRISHERLTRTCFNDYDREIALVAERRDPTGGEPEILAVARLCRGHGGGEAEFAVLVSDKWQEHGLGTELTRRCIEIARAEGIDAVVASVLPGNREMLAIFERLGFHVSSELQDGLVSVRMDLRSIS